MQIQALLNLGMIFAPRKGAKNLPLIFFTNLNSSRTYAMPKFNINIC